MGLLWGLLPKNWQVKGASQQLLIRAQLLVNKKYKPKLATHPRPFGFIFATR
jgi:hypothetical protein